MEYQTVTNACAEGGIGLDQARVLSTGRSRIRACEDIRCESSETLLMRVTFMVL